MIGQSEIELVEIKTAILKNYLETKNLKSFNRLLQLGGVDFPNWHYRMLNDEKRNTFYQTYIGQNVKDKIVVDIGAGTGFLSCLSLKYGAKKVYAIEQNWVMTTLIEHSMKSDIDAGRLVLIKKNVFDIDQADFSDSVDVVLHEIFGSDALAESVLKVFTMLAKKELFRTAQIFPHSIKLCLEPIEIKREEIPQTANPFGEIDFSDINSLASIFVHDLSDRSRCDQDWGKAGDQICFFEHDLTMEYTSEIKKISVPLNPKANAIRVWFEIADEKKNLRLSTDLAIYQGHWVNKIIRIPPDFKEQTINISFNVCDDKLLLWAME
jgi:hypothetical protein